MTGGITGAPFNKYITTDNAATLLGKSGIVKRGIEVAG